ncbi:MAG: carboxypeptidase regulatory-like domain-containing protein [Flavobacteriales bacterium]|nr:carboxypeptidase regulatory-like domain-containing protein [Flavobacteriales bacterium]
MYRLFISLVAVLTLFSCKKEAGKGGKASISGVVVANYYCDDNNTLLETSNPGEQRVYLTYGSNTSFDDDTRTASDGSYTFKFLNPGTYTISTFSECRTCPKGSNVVSTTVEIGKKDRELEATQLSIDDYSNRACPADKLKGFASITGTLQVIYIDENNYDTIATETLANERVFISRANELTHFEDVRSSADGTFRFVEMPIGDFQIYAYSECIVCNAGKEAKVIKVSVKQEAESVQAGILSVVVLKKR